MTIYSYSRLKCYMQCPQKYKLQYIDKLKTKAEESIECYLGKRVHETLKQLYQDLQHQKENTLEDLLVFLHNMWRKNWNNSIIIVKREYNLEDYLEMAEKYIVDYYNRYKPFNQGRTIALEKRIFIDLDGSQGHKLCGCIDRVTKTKDGFYQIHDYKTCSKVPSQKDIQKDKQLVLYAIGLKARYPYIKKIKLIWHFLKHNKEINSTRTDEELEELKNKTIQLINTVETAEEFPANPSKLCNWCKFKSICRQ